MTGHNLINTGGGWRCLRCGDNWDIGEEQTEACLPERDTETGDLFDDAPIPAEIPHFTVTQEQCARLAARWRNAERGATSITAIPIDVKQGFRQLTARLRGETPKLDVVVGFAGTKGSGKDTAASVLLDVGYEQVRFADGLKAMLRALLRYRGVPGNMIERYVEGDLKEEPCPALNGRTMRHAMQTLGTDWGRKMIHEDLWADATADQVERRGGRVVVTDVRMPNEAEALRRMGAAIILIDRDTGSADTHESETSLAQVRTDFVIHNDGSVDDLKKAVRDHLIG